MIKLNIYLEGRKFAIVLLLGEGKVCQNKSFTTKQQRRTKTSKKKRRNV
jgi:hypothetical protein